MKGRMLREWFGLTELRFVRDAAQSLMFRRSEIYPKDSGPKKWPELTRPTFDNLRQLHAPY